MTAEVLFTLGLRPGMRVHDDTAAAPEHTVAAEPLYLGDGCWRVSYVDGGCAVVGARHSWPAETTP